VTVFIDTAVLMYAAGSAHPLRDPCVRIMDWTTSGRLDAVTSVEVVQELVHRFVSIGLPDVAARLAGQALDQFAPVLPVTHAVTRRLPALIERYPRLQARDLVHVATCIHEGIGEIVSPDRAFDAVAEVRRVDPVELAARLG
jgi:hypothetical protein